MKNSISFDSSIDENRRQIHNLGAPQLNSSATSKIYVDTGLQSKLAKTINSILDLNNNQINNPSGPKNGNDACNKKYVDEKIQSEAINPSHPQKNVSDYVMKNVKEISIEYNVEVDKIDR